MAGQTEEIGKSYTDSKPDVYEEEIDVSKEELNHLSRERDELKAKKE